MLKKIHYGLCGSHIGFRQLISKAFRQGFFWSSALKDARHYVKTCQACQMMGPKSTRPLEPSQLIAPTWPPAKMENRSYRTTSHGTRQLQFSRCRGRVLYKMDRSKATNKHNLQNNLQVLLAKHYLQVQSPQTKHIQRNQHK